MPLRGRPDCRFFQGWTGVNGRRTVTHKKVDQLIQEGGDVVSNRTFRMSEVERLCGRGVQPAVQNGLTPGA
jgi:hypothetical protein